MVSRGTRRPCPVTAPPSLGFCGTTATAPQSSESGTSRPTGNRVQPVRSTVGRTAGGSTTSTGFSVEDRASGIPAWPRIKRSSAPRRSTTTRTTRSTFPTPWRIGRSSGSTRVRAQDAAQALLRLLLHRLQPCPTPRHEDVGRQVQGDVRPGLGQAARGDVRSSEGARGDPGRYRAHPARRGVPGVERPLRRSEDVLRPPDGGLLRVSRRTPTTTSGASSMPSRISARSTTRSSCGSGATTGPAWRERSPDPSTSSRRKMGSR